MKNALTNRQKDLLVIIYEYIKDIGYPPTFEEMRERLGVSSNQSVVDLLEKLARGGFVKKGGSAARGITILPLGYEALGEPPLAAFLGATSAGAPMETFEITGEWQAISGEVARLKNEVSILKITGDSMINAGINHGDMVLVQKADEFISGDIVLAQVGSESTIKRFISEDKPPYVYLKPENPAYSIQPFTDETRLTGKVISKLASGTWKPIT